MGINAPHEIIGSFFEEAKLDRVYFHQLVSCFFEHDATLNRPASEVWACSRALGLVEYFISAGFGLYETVGVHGDFEERDITDDFSAFSERMLWLANNNGCGEFDSDKTYGWGHYLYDDMRCDRGTVNFPPWVVALFD